MPTENEKKPPADEVPVERMVRRPNPTRAEFEAWFRAPARGLDRDGDGYRLMGAQTAWQGWKAGMAALADTVQPAAWVFEWGAIDLPRGDPSRITCMSAHPTEAEALAQADGCDFKWRVYPAYCIGDGRTPNAVLTGPGNGECRDGSG